MKTIRRGKLWMFAVSMLHSTKYQRRFHFRLSAFKGFHNMSFSFVWRGHTHTHTHKTS